MMTVLGTALLSGCAKIIGGSYCDIAKPHYFSSANTVDILLEHDRDLLVSTTVHNETYKRLCNDDT